MPPSKQLLVLITVASVLLEWLTALLEYFNASYCSSNYLPMQLGQNTMWVGHRKQGINEHLSKL